MAHTPGPWKTKFTDTSEGGMSIHLTMPNGTVSMENERLANAALISAAPELLEALCQLLKCSDNQSQEWARDAIAKAEGR